MAEHTDKTAILVKRVTEHEQPNTTELAKFAESAGFTIVGELLQEREEDPEYHIGEGKVRELAALIERADADTVIVGNRLSPYQKFNIGLEIPTGTTVLDYFQVFSQALKQKAASHREALQAELTELRYDLPRLDAKKKLASRTPKPEFMGLDAYDEAKESRVKDRISAISADLDQYNTEYRSRVESHREDGVRSIALFGYTNSGRSTLFRRLVPSLTINPSRPDDLEDTVETNPIPLTTFESTTRKMDYQQRDVLLTDTIGAFRDIPFWMYDSLQSALAPIFYADGLVITVDLTDSLSEIREKIGVIQAIEGGSSKENMLYAFTKADLLTEAEVEEKVEYLEEFVEHETVAVSAKTGYGIEELKTKIENLLPTLQREHLQIPMTEQTMKVVSWIHDNTDVVDEEYLENSVYLEFEGEEQAIKRARSKVTNLNQNRLN